ncbi:hypothetical protein CEXT_396041 [Caerostris extrusa]|uniref:Uncharacterized protein n=1 Tax=Caerostris extrusa TaxID=172846 RepID=A0AAV4QQB4_CAEEX|nr:hypothetical protein CEXT_396041 [Caerostris extrusa]
MLFRINTSSFLLSAIIKYHNQQKRETSNHCQRVKNCRFRDDLIAEIDTYQDALEITRKMKHIMKDAWVLLRKEKSNGMKLMELGKTNFDIQLLDSSISLGSNLTKVIGMAWGTTTRRDVEMYYT